MIRMNGEQAGRAEWPPPASSFYVSMGRVQACEIRKSTWVSLG